MGGLNFGRRELASAAFGLFLTDFFRAAVAGRAIVSGRFPPPWPLFGGLAQGHRSLSSLS